MSADTLDAQSAALVDHDELAPLTQPVTALVTFLNAAMVAQDAKRSPPSRPSPLQTQRRQS